MKDDVTSAASQRRFSHEIDAVSNAPTTVRELVSSHSPFLAQPAALAIAIADSAGASDT
ncbi:hypothetical protein [Streptomyces sp. NRRL F-5755]|uniref:hypothetical protein n=1 Tax=Streptomyces sp. NRRL F-5755 TaxID=1519475 RepID=UPI00133184AC|nr:hypothetical protein [Streptomyces sp. NRRL F-5755]